ncbi:UNVERIFIED_CONTAM: hypothetical protein RKD50_009703 [Streptomyces canus]|jgi:hypothetical protein
MTLDRLIVLLLVVFFTMYVSLHHPVVREPLLVGAAVGTLGLAVMLAK